MFINIDVKEAVNLGFPLNFDIKLPEGLGNFSGHLPPIEFTSHSDLTIFLDIPIVKLSNTINEKYLTIRFIYDKSVSVNKGHNSIIIGFIIDSPYKINQGIYSGSGVATIFYD
ncbi:MAG: hypothetical protein VX212_12310 [Pseudomonadota bacterium]|nr:hypothetical protein [Pseudomonadota bacterium]